MNKSILMSACLISFLAISFSSCVRVEKRVVQEVVINANAAPALLPGTLSQMTTPGFWIGMHPDPDRVVIPAEDIADFNKSIRLETRVVRDLTTYPASVSGKRIGDTLKNDVGYISSKKYVQQDGTLADEAFFQFIQNQMGIPSIPAKVDVKFGFVTSYTPQRILPTGTGLYRSLKSIEIDRLQNSSLDIGTPVVILHTTSDGYWTYVVSPLCEGWVRSDHVGICTRESMAAYLKPETFAVTVSSKTDLFRDENMRSHFAYVRMGCRFPAKNTDNPYSVQLILPFRGEDGQCSFAEAYVSESDVSLGFLPYTPRTIILQAFKLLHSPYGWGDMHGDQDCSRFIQMIFASVGIDLPRNSLQQARVGRLIASFNRSATEENRLTALSDNAFGGTAILHMNGHIMLFLGNVDGSPYAIHDMQGYSEPHQDGERMRVVNRVVVSNLRLGEGTKSGAFLKRLVTVRAFEKSSS